MKRKTLDAARKTPMWRRILGYPFVMIFLFALTALSLVSVISNVMQLMAGIRSLPLQQVSLFGHPHIKAIQEILRYDASNMHNFHRYSKSSTSATPP